MTINGQGLKGDNLHDVKVTFNGVPCLVTKSESQQTACISDDDKPAPAYDDESDSLKKTASDEKTSSDDESTCQLFLDQTNKFDKESFTAPDITQISIRHGASAWRDYIMVKHQDSSSEYQSEWIPMEAGSFYNFEGFHMEYVSSDHFSISLEFQQVDTACHYHANVAIQTVDGVCPEFNYDYFYIEPTGQITAQSLSSDVDLNTTKTNLPTEDIRVHLANAECHKVKASESEINCTLNHHPAARSQDVEVTLDCIDVALVVDSMSSSINLN